MDNGLHFISGLPRSGSTLLAALLRQNPKIHAGMSSPVGPLFQRLISGMGPQNEFAAAMTEMQKHNILHGLFENYYADLHTTKTVFDTSRLWCSRMPALEQLFPQARVIVCVRDLPWIMDSFERILRKNPFVTSRMFPKGSGANVYTRVNSLASANGTVGFAWNAVQEAFYGETAGRLLVIDYEVLTREPQRTMEFIYDSLDLPHFDHDFENVSYDAREVDAQLGVPGLHAVGSKVRFIERPTILPPDLFERFTGQSFWKWPAANRRKVPVLVPATDRPGPRYRNMARRPMEGMHRMRLGA